jgi:alpha-amylase
MKFHCFFLFLLILSFGVACKQNTQEASGAGGESTEVLAAVPEWTKNAVLYEVNVRQITPEGTFKAFSEHLPRLHDMGVDILWLMPIHPVSKKNRKGKLGSNYAVADYKAVNPEFGTMQDFKELVKKAHDLGMHLIIDWVPNHTGWDHPWITQHPEWYTRDSLGNVVDPINPETGESWGWTDVADLNYDNAEMRKAMIEAMSFWVKEADIDGFRCDVAHGVPLDFWVETNTALNGIKPLFMLAEAEIPDLRNKGGFLADYSWKFKDLTNAIAKGEKKAFDINEYLALDQAAYQHGYHIYFTTNHDENSWAGTEFERLGDGHQAFAVLCATIDGMPLIYNGQETATNKRLRFFEKDTIEWQGSEYVDFYKTLCDLKEKNKALWNGEAGGRPLSISMEDNDVFAFHREKDGDKVIVVVNLSGEEKNVQLKDSSLDGAYSNVFAKGTVEFSSEMTIYLKPWDFLVLSNK